MGDSQYAYRFAVGGPSSPRSAIWRLWAEYPAAGGVDLYFGVRSALGKFKISFHGSGVCQEAVDGNLFAQARAEQNLGDLKRPSHRWHRELHSAAEQAIYALVVPHYCLREEPSGIEDLNKVDWRPTPAPPESVVFCLTAQASGAKPNDAATGQLLIEWDLKHGETIRLREFRVVLPESFAQAFNGAAEQSTGRHGLQIGGELPKGPNRSALWMTRSDGLHFVVDVPVQIAHNSKHAAE